jgi:hypothetical protein
MLICYNEPPDMVATVTDGSRISDYPQMVACCTIFIEYRFLVCCSSERMYSD